MTALRSVLALIALTTPAIAAPKIEPVLQAGGIALPGEARAGAFCDRSRQAVMWLDSGDAIAIDRKGAITTLGNLGRPFGFGNRMVCDRQDRVVALDRDQLVILEGGKTRTVKAAAQLSYVGLLGDGRVAVVDRDGTVSTWNGGPLVTSWKTTATLPTFGGVQFSPDGSTLAFSQRGAINLVDASGLRVGPAGYNAVWETANELVVATANSGLARWKISDPVTTFTVVDSAARGSVMFWAGPQLVQQLGPTATVRVLGAPPVVTSLTRWPSGANTFAAGNASFMVIAGSKRAYVVDLTRDGAIVPELSAHAPINDMVFSPDGKQLAITGGDALLIAKLGSKTIERREYPNSIFAPRLFWEPKSLAAVFLTQRVTWTSHGMDVVPLKDRGASLDEHGNPVDVSAMCKQAFGARMWRGYVAARCGSKVSFGLPDKPAMFSMPMTTSAFAIAGATPQLVYAEGQKIMIAGANGVARELTKLRGFITSIVPSADGKRLAIAHDDSITIWDLDRGQLMTEVNPAGRMARIAWSPDGSRLAVATGMAVAIWRL